MIKHFALSVALFLGVFASGCGATVNAGGGGTSGGVPGAACNSTLVNQGCNGSQIVQCTDNKWAAVQSCTSPQICKEKADPTAPGTSKKVAECSTTTVVTDTVGGSDATGGTDAASGDGSVSDVAGDMLACVEAKCVAPITTCKANATCKKAWDCAMACPSTGDGSCQTTCAAAAKADLTAGPLAAAVQTCMQGASTDCMPKAVCGNGMCETGESPSTCAQDCKTGPVCGNGTCEPGETTASCVQDCPSTGPKCGDGICQSNENVEMCPQDCHCGNGFCDAGETTSTCPQDCTTGPKCGNGVCESGETSTSCVQDCPSSGEICTYNVPSSFPGCTSSMDQSVVQTLNTNASAAAQFAGIVSDCTLKQGCTAKGDTCGTDQGKSIAKGSCIAKCITTTSSAPMSANCAWCYGMYSGECGYNYCLSECAVDATAPGCKNCLLVNCDAKRDACIAGNALPTFVCGNGTCETGETKANCAQDCGTSGPVCGNGTCESGETSSKCPQDCPNGPICGNGICDTGENSALCPSDCPPQNGGAGCTAKTAGGGCGGCACEACVCKGPLPNGSDVGDKYCCDTIWDSQCVTECTSCGAICPVP
jgi:hypothetical protein